jgi:hypothetical protein
VAVGLLGFTFGYDAVGWFVGIALATTLYAGAFSFLPALIAIVLAEAFGWRSVFYWLAVGGAVGFAGYALTNFIGGPYRLPLFLATGFVGALVYWAIAGRFSGVNNTSGMSA